MIATDRSPSISQSSSSEGYAEGSLVRIKHNDTLYRIVSPAAWSEDEQKTPTHYNVTGPGGKLHRMVPAERLSPRSNALQSAVLAALLEQDLRTAPLQRMLAAPLATMAMAHRLLAPAFVANHDLRQIAEALVPRYFQTHCHRCGSDLNNLHHPACPDCEGLLCKCGGCRCNWSFPSSGIHGVTGPRIRSFSRCHFSSR